MCTVSGHEFRSIVELWVKSFCGKAGRAEVPLSEVPDLLTAVVRSDPFLPFKCEECDLAFATVQSLGLHRRRIHGYVHPIRLMVWGSCARCAEHSSTHVRGLFSILRTTVCRAKPFFRRRAA